MSDLTGERFGRLTVVRATSERKNGRVVWECLCDCGNTVYSVSTHLKQGGTRSCGCLHKEAHTRDLTGERFGRLTVVRATSERKNDYVVWECLCDCGNTVFPISASLVRGNTRSCGCLIKELVSKDLTGERFGRLTAVRATSERKNDYVVWECLCDCGNTVFPISASLISGNTKSCGCLIKDKSTAKIHSK